MTNETRRGGEPRKSDEELAQLLIRLATDADLRARYVANPMATVDAEFPNMDPVSRQALEDRDAAVIRDRLVLSNQSSDPVSGS